MVGFTPRESVQLSQWEHAVAGATSGSLTRGICQPLDVLKIRFQLQIEPIKKGGGSKYSGVLQAAGTIYSSFEVLTRAVWVFLPAEMTTSQWRPLTHTVCGGFSGCVASAVIHPIDVLRTRFIAQGEPKIYSGMGDACRKIMSSEGLRGFYKGLSPSVLQIAPQMGLQFGFYSLFTGLWNRAKGVWFDELPSYMESLTCGSGAGFMSKLIIYPLDIVKKRLQVQGFESAREQFGATRQYSGLVSCLVKVGKEEGGARPSRRSRRPLHAFRTRGAAATPPSDARALQEARVCNYASPVDAGRPVISARNISPEDPPGPLQRSTQWGHVGPVRDDGRGCEQTTPEMSPVTI
ncbi:hypothetical protein BaRGS_00002524, partial [Batillaria attramentaria]